MGNVLLYGFISTLPLFLGSFFGTVFRFKEKIMGEIAAFGAGAMIAALTFGLMEESFNLGGFDNSIIGFIVGGLLFVLGDLAIIRFGGRGHKRIYNTNKTTGWGILLAAILDGIPESIALGISLLLSPKIGLLVLVAIFFNNLPEAISSAHDLKKAGKKNKEIILIWLAVALICFFFVFLGYTVFVSLSPSVTATFEAIAAGGILAMLASTMMPEAYRESGLNSSLATISGFLLIFILSKIGV